MKMNELYKWIINKIFIYLRIILEIYFWPTPKMPGNTFHFCDTMSSRDDFNTYMEQTHRNAQSGSVEAQNNLGKSCHIRFV